MENTAANIPQTSSPRSAESNGAARPVLEQAKEQGQQVLQQTQQKAGQIVDQVRTQVVSQLESQKDRASEGLTSVAHALRQSGQHLREQDQQAISDYAERAAGAIEQFSGSMSRYSVPEIFGELESFAHRQPALFLGSTFVLGFLAMRFLKSSSPSNGGSTYAGSQPTSANRPPFGSSSESDRPASVPTGAADASGRTAAGSGTVRPGNGS